MPISSNRRQRAIEFATPKVADLVIVERVDASKNVNAAETAYDSTYGTAHPDTTRFPDFKLALIKNSDDEQGQFQDWYYVKDRANQDDYNWEFQAAGAESPRYDTVVRTYVIPRYGTGTAGVDYYDTNIPKIGFNTATDAAALLSLGQRKDECTYMPSGDTSLTPFDGAFLTTTGPSLTSDPIKFDTDYIFFERKQVRSGDEFLDTLYVVEQRVYVKRVAHFRVDADDAFPYNDPADGSSGAPFGALISKETILHRNETVKADTYFLDGSTSSEGAQVSDPPDLMEVTDAGGTYGQSAAYVFTNPGTIYRVANEAYTHNASGTNQDYNFWGVDAYGIMREGKQLSDNWYALVERQVITTSGVTNQVSKYITYQNYSWPAVLSTTHEQEDGSLDTDGGIFGYTWTRRTGGGDTVIYPVYARHAYSGPTKAEVTIFWRKEKFAATGGALGVDGGNNALTNVIPMLPLPISFISPLSSVNVPPTLHEDISLSITTGTEHPTWEFAGAQFDYPATNFTDWPVSMIISDTQKPYRGGWLRERIKIFAPKDHLTDMSGKQDADVATST